MTSQDGPNEEGAETGGTGPPEHFLQAEVHPGGPPTMEAFRAFQKPGATAPIPALPFGGVRKNRQESGLMLIFHLQRANGKQGKGHLGKWRKGSALAASDSLL